MAPKPRRQVMICDGKMSVRGIAPMSPRQGPPLPQFAACALAGTALAAVLLVSPGDLVKRSPPQVAYETVIAAGETTGIKLPAPPAPPSVFMSDNVTVRPSVASSSDNVTWRSGGAVRATFTVLPSK